jgi:hypothetical protein
MGGLITLNGKRIAELEAEIESLRAKQFQSQ